MKSATMLLKVASAIAAAAVVFAIASPKTVHAFVATLVQVTNTDANSIPTHAVDNNARSAVYLQLSGSQGDTVAFGAQSFVFTSFQDVNGTYVVPSGKRLVIDSVYGGMFVQPNEIPGTVFVDTNVNGLFGGFVLPLERAPDGRLFYSANHTAYADAGTQVRFFASRSSTANVGDIAFAALYGHLEDVP